MILEKRKDKVESCVKEFDKVFKGYKLQFDEPSYYMSIRNKDTDKYVCGERFEELAHFIRCVKLAKSKRLFRVLTDDFIDRLEHLFSMFVSIQVYGSINLDTILSDEYIQRIDINNKIKLFFAEYVKGCVTNIRFAGTDGEGCCYNSCDYTNIEY